MLSEDIRLYVIRPALQVVNLWSESAEILVYGTGLIESNYDHLYQIGRPRNGGIGMWQDEPSDFLSLVKWLQHPMQRDISEKLLAACYYTATPLDPQVLASNLKFAALICRLHYYRARIELPDADDAAGFSMYHKKYYNTALGKSDELKNVELFQGVIDGKL